MRNSEKQINNELFINEFGMKIELDELKSKSNEKTPPANRCGYRNPFNPTGTRHQIRCKAGCQFKQGYRPVF